jgi:hypothetical protein
LAGAGRSALRSVKSFDVQEVAGGKVWAKTEGLRNSAKMKAKNLPKKSGWVDGLAAIRKAEAFVMFFLIKNV